MKYSRLNSLRMILADLFTTRVLRGPSLAFRTSQILNHLHLAFPAVRKPVLGLIAKLPAGEVVIENRIGRYAINPRTESVVVSSLCFEYFLRDWVTGGDARRKSVFLDIGANIGVYSLLAVRAGFARVVAFEPNPVTFEALKRNLGLSKARRVVAVNKGLGARKGRLLFLQHERNPGQSRVISPEEREECERLGTVTKVDIVPLDAYLRQSGITPAAVRFLKIDVEGYEQSVLKGMVKTLEGARPGARLFIELLDDREKKRRTTAFIERHGWELEESFQHNYLFKKVNKKVKA